MLQVKIVLFILAIIGTGSGAWYIKTLISENAVLTASLASTTEAFGKYATDVEAEVDAWSQAAQALSEKYQIARDERDAKIKRLTQTDFTKMAQRHPQMLADRINRGTERVFAELEAITRGARDSKSAKSATP